eukprot:symbB.v1.2.033779.t2/scaffold4220.1/size42939/2
MEGNLALRSPNIYRRLPLLCTAMFCLGAGLEYVMCKTGFYNVTTVREGQREAGAKAEDEEFWMRVNSRREARARMISPLTPFAAVFRSRHRPFLAPVPHRFRLGGVSQLMRSSAYLALICSISMALMSSAFVVPNLVVGSQQVRSTTLEVSRPVLPAMSQPRANGTSGLFSMAAGVMATATFLAGSTRAMLLRSSESEARNLSSEVTGDAAGFPEALHESFFFMEERRQMRQANGRLMARGVCSAISEVAMFLGFALYGLAALRTQLLGPPKKDIAYLALPILVTSCAVAVTIHSLAPMGCTSSVNAVEQKMESQVRSSEVYVASDGSQHENSKKTTMKMKGKGPKVSFNDVMVHEYVVEPRSSQRISARDDKDGVPHLEEYLQMVHVSPEILQKKVQHKRCRDFGIQCL